MRYTSPHGLLRCLYIYSWRTGTTIWEWPRVIISSSFLKSYQCGSLLYPYPPFLLPSCFPPSLFWPPYWHLLALEDPLHRGRAPLVSACSAGNLSAEWTQTQPLLLYERADVNGPSVHLFPTAIRFDPPDRWWTNPHPSVFSGHDWIRCGWLSTDTCPLMPATP